MQENTQPLTETKPLWQPKEMLIFLLVAFGLPFLMGVPLAIAQRAGSNTDVYPSAQMFYPAAGVMLAYLFTRRAALHAAETATVQPAVRCAVTVDYPLYERAAALIAGAGGVLEPPVFTDRVGLCWQMRAGAEGPLLDSLRELTRGRAETTVSPPYFSPI